MITATMHFDLGNFHLYSNGKKLSKYSTIFDSQPTTKEEKTLFTYLKDMLVLIRQSYFEDGAERIGVQVFYINPEIHATLKDILFTLHGHKLDKVKIKYRKIEIHPGQGVSYEDVLGAG